MFLSGAQRVDKIEPKQGSAAGALPLTIFGAGKETGQQSLNFLYLVLKYQNKTALIH